MKKLKKLIIISIVLLSILGGCDLPKGRTEYIIIKNKYINKYASVCPEPSYGFNYSTGECEFYTKYEKCIKENYIIVYQDLNSGVVKSRYVDFERYNQFQVNISYIITFSAYIDLINSVSKIE